VTSELQKRSPNRMIEARFILSVLLEP